MSKKVLFITQEMKPYVPESPMAATGRELPPAVQDAGAEIRTFMPRWGIIIERRNQLHEVIRLSGMNIVIDDTDHPLIIKVASLPAARMQVYFIDNDDYFHKRKMMRDDAGHEYEDNVERAVFYARGVLETLKKLRWTPDVIYCQGWMTSIVPFFVKTAYAEDPAFMGTKVVYSPYAETPSLPEMQRLVSLISFKAANEDALKERGLDTAGSCTLDEIAVRFSDAVIEGEAGAQPEAVELARSQGKPVLLKAEMEEKPGIVCRDFFTAVSDAPAAEA